MNVGASLAALLALIDKDRETRCITAQRRAREERAAILANAWREAHTRLRCALDPLRAELQERIVRESAVAGQERRLAHTRHIRAALAQAWAGIEQALRERWQVPASRRIWIERWLASSACHLGNGPWHVEHGKLWAVSDSACVRSWRDAHAPGEVEFALDQSIAAGLRVRCGHNVLDVTLDDLIEDRALIDGALHDTLGNEEAGTAVMRDGPP